MRALPIALAAAVLAAGCGGGGPKKATPQFRGEQAQVAAVVHDLERAGRRRDAGAICERVLARSLVRRLRASGIDCAGELGRALRQVGSVRLRVNAVRVTSDRATAIVGSTVGGRRRTDRLSFVREGGAWRAVSLGSAAG